MPSSRRIVAVGALGVIGYLAWRKGLLGGARGLVARADAAQQIAATSEVDACGNAPMSASAFLATTGGVEAGSPGYPDMTNARMAMEIGGAATRVAGAVNPAAGAVAGIGTAVATTLFSIFASSPPDPVIRLLIAEMPYNWSARSNVPPEGGIWALDRCGYRHEVIGTGGPMSTTGTSYIPREIIAVNWKVFGMMPEGSPISNASEIEAIRMPRPADPAVLRRMLGKDIRFYVGREDRLRGPWDADSNVPPLAGSPAMWAALAGEYEPIHTASSGEF